MPAIKYNKIGERIRALRTASGLSQEQLAEMLNLSREHVNLIENGNRYPSLETLLDIANAFKVSSEDILIDSLEYTVPTTQAEIHRLMMDCNTIEEQILLNTIRELRKILTEAGI